MTHRIAIVCDKLNVTRHGGSNFSIHRLATELTEQGHDVTVCTLNFEFENDPPADRTYTVDEQKLAGYTEADRALRVLPTLTEIASDHDVLHVYLPGVLPIVGLWRALGGDTPVVGHLNNYTPFCSNSARMADGCWQSCSFTDKLRHDDASGTDLLSKIPRLAFNSIAAIPLMNQLDAIIALSPQLARIYTEVGVDKSIISVVPNMADPTFPQRKAIADGGDDS